MCGRFNSISSAKDFLKIFNARLDGQELTPNHNVAPTALIYALINTSLEVSGLEVARLEVFGQRVLTSLRWGLVPSWAKDKSKGAGMINARAETLHQKPSFKNLLSQHRCVIPMQGFYEWSVIDGVGSRPAKQAHYISRTDGAIMAVAGLWTSWRDPLPAGHQNTNNVILNTCTIITTQANNKLSDIHHRMPVILEQDGVEQWLSTDKVARLDILVPAGEEIVISEITKKLERSSNIGRTQLTDNQTGRLF